ncbi:bacterial type II secretion system protein F domain protein [Enterococcus plantarum]|uniref:type II secretion system F family protein n=1 Tax=Enterococcus plantarum TaxID=1077675 RepID=UPI00084DBDD9|nr:type II secretion system F family protein [Enterococcus plantarum]OEG20951.1 bacterial type II secretion system protein F domain protein [Enterococcus plantarum]
MAIYSYEAQTIQGNIKKGRLRADSLHEAGQSLKKRGLRSTLLIEQEETFATKEIQLFNKVSVKLLAEYLQKFSTLIDCGISITSACEMLAEQEQNKNFKKILTEICEEIQGGDALSTCYSKHPNAFPSMLISIVRAAEMSGTLDATLLRMSTYYEKKAKARGGVITAMIYPIIMLVLSLCVGIFLIVSIVPMFVTVFESLDAELPAITKITIGLSGFLQTKGWVLLVVIAIVVIAFKLMMRNAELKFKWHSLTLRMPVFGELIQKSNLNMMLSTLSILLESSVSISKALGMSADAVDNLYIKQLIHRCQAEVEKGGSLSDVFSKDKIIPPLVTQMTIVGESTGSLESMLKKLSDMFEEEVEMLGERIKLIMEPITIIVICVIVGLIVSAILLPMFSMYDAVQG